MKQKATAVRNEYTASSKADLLLYLKQQYVGVPFRTKGMKPQHYEKWAVFDC